MRFRDQKGFSLVELMVVVAIIGILATIALPRFRAFQAKAKMAEAVTNLSSVDTLYQAWGLENNNAFGTGGTGAGGLTTLSDVGFQAPSNARYTYIETTPAGAGSNIVDGYRATATSIGTNICATGSNVHTLDPTNAKRIRETTACSSF